MSNNVENFATFEDAKAVFDALSIDDKVKTVNYLREKHNLSPLTLEEIRENGGLSESDKVAMGLV
jgi:hypothetical protein